MILFFSVLSLRSQYNEIGPMIGGSIYQGDLSPADFNDNFKLIRPSAGIYFQKGVNDYISFRINFIVAELEADDNLNTDNIWRFNRNLHFRNTIYEGSVLFEYNLFGASFYGNRAFSPYVFLGAGFYKHNPRSYLNGELYYLRNYGTEGQGLPGYDKPYSLFQINIPVGGGIKYIINDKFNLSLEFGGRVTFTDYLDDVSVRYPDLAYLGAERGELSVRLSNKTLGTTDIYQQSNQIRGNSWRDFFYVGSLKLGINLNELGGNKGDGCYRF